MVLTIIAALFAAAPIDLAASAPRAAFAACLKQAVSQAKSSKVAVDAFDAFVRGQCAASEADLRKAVIAIDVKNGVSRKDANENAELELEDYFLMTLERYEAQLRQAAAQ